MSRVSILAMLLFVLSLPNNVNGERTSSDEVVAILTDESSPTREKKDALETLFNRALSEKSQKRVAEYCIDRLIGPEGGTMDLPPANRAFIRYTEGSVDERRTFFPKLLPLFSAKTFPNGDRITEPDRLALAAMLVWCADSHDESFHLLDKKLRAGESWAVFPMVWSGSRRFIPSVIERLEALAKKAVPGKFRGDSERYQLVYFLDKFPSNRSAREAIKKHFLLLGPSSCEAFIERRKSKWSLPEHPLLSE